MAARPCLLAGGAQCAWSRVRPASRRDVTAISDARCVSRVRLHAAIRGQRYSPNAQYCGDQIIAMHGQRIRAPGDVLVAAASMQPVPAGRYDGLLCRYVEQLEGNADAACHLHQRADIHARAPHQQGVARTESIVERPAIVEPDRCSRTAERSACTPLAPPQHVRLHRPRWPLRYSRAPHGVP